MSPQGETRIFLPSSWLDRFAAPQGRRDTPALFIHSGWRSAGTWMWSEFRARPETMAFYEPLNELLVGMTAENMPLERPGGWDSGHPDTRPYFEEYAPLLARRRGIRGYERSFAYDRYFMREDEAHPKLAAYLHSLLALAEPTGKIPVLKFVRSLGRVGWMRRQFPAATHVTILRDPLAQWASGSRFAQNQNPYFLAAPLAIVAQSLKHPAVGAVVDALELRLDSLRKGSFDTTYRACVDFVAQSSPKDLYRGSLAFWLPATFCAIRHADLTIDSDRLAESSTYRETIEHDLFARTGIAVDFSRVRATKPADIPCGLSRDELERIHGLAMQAGSALAQANRTDAATAPAIELLRQKLEDVRARTTTAA